MDKLNNVEVFYKNEFISINAKRLKLQLKAEDLYPKDYDLNSLFISFEKRKLEKDIKRGSKKALKKIQENAGLCIYNLGTGHGYSVLDIVKNFEKATGVKIPYVIKPRRPGDIATCYCDPTKAKEELGWEAQYGIEDMCADSWRWQKNNPNGYED